MLMQHCEINGFIKRKWFFLIIIIIMKIIEDLETKIKINGTTV